MSKFWPDQRAAILKQCTEQKDFKVHNDFPLARIKRIMKVRYDLGEKERERERGREGGECEEEENDKKECFEKN